MNLDTRVLALTRPAMTGPDVDRLHEELSRLGDPYRALLRDDVGGEGRHRFGDATRRAVVAFQEAHRERLQWVIAGALDGTGQVRWTGEWGVVDPATAQVINEEVVRLTAPFVVRGRVEYEDGAPAEGVRVQVYDRDITTFRTELGEPGGVVTNSGGVFPDVRYTSRKHAFGEGRRGPTADIVISVSGAERQHEVELLGVHRLAGSPWLSDEETVRDLVLGWPAAPVEVLRIVVRRAGGAAVSEYERIMAALRPLLIRETTPDRFDEVRHRDVTFAARETGEDRALIQTLVDGWRLATRARLPAETFYGLLRDGAPVTMQALPVDLDTLLSFGRAAWDAKLDEAFKLHLVPESLRGEMPRWLDRLDAERAQAALRATPDEDERVALADVLRYAGIPEDQQTRFAVLLNQAAPGADVWQAVTEGPGWSREHVDSARQAIELSDVISGHAPLLKALRERGGVPGARALAALERRDIESLIDRIEPPSDIPGENATDRRAAYLAEIDGALRESYPAQFVSRALRDVDDDDLHRTADWLDTVLLQTSERPQGIPAFDLRTMPATAYLRDYGDRLFEGVAAETRDLRATALKRVQRVYQLASTPEQIVPLLRHGLDSARHITRFSAEHFARQYGEALGGPDAADAIHAKAGYIHGTLLNLFIDARRMMLIEGASAMPSAVMHMLDTAVRIPRLDELFGSDDLCACASCLSVLSPAAYFVDLLQFLDLPISGSSTTNLNVLLKRRPDLAHIQLTCDNTNTRIPYVDLVNEILASYVAHEKPFPYNDPIKGVITANAEELRVNPIPLTDVAQQAAATAYERLQAAVFPFTLPYHHWLTVIRLFLGHFGVRRDTLMRRFQPDDEFDTEMAIAADTLGLSPEDFEVITLSNFDGSSSTLAPTLEALFGFVETVAAGTAPANHVTPEFVTNDPRRRLIKAVQNVLKNVSTSAGLTAAIRAAIKVNGQFDAPTAAAVTVYRTDHALPGGGGTDAAFWGALDAEGNRPLSVLMCHAPMFLQQTGLTFEELTALVQTKFLNPLFNDRVYFSAIGVTPEELMAFMKSGAATPPAAMLTKITTAGLTVTDFMNHVTPFRAVIVLNTPPSALCDLDQTTICHMDGSLLTPVELREMQQAIRLWRRLGWTLHDTDLVLSAFPFSDAFTLILRLADMKRLIDDLKIPVDQLMSFWRPIDTWDEGSLYERLFRSKTAQSLDPLFKLDDVRREIEAFTLGGGTPPLLVDHTALLLAAFRIGADDLAGLSATLSDGNLNLANVSALYRQVVLARALDLTIPDFLTLIELHGANPLEPPIGAIESRALTFVRMARAEAGFQVSLVAYLVAHRLDARNAALLTAGQHRTLVAAIRVGLEDIQREYVAKDDPQGDLLARQLAAIVPPPHADTLARMVYSRLSYSQPLTGVPATTVFPAAAAGKIRYDQDRQELVFAGVMTPGEQTMLKAPAFVSTLPLPVQVPYATAVDGLFTAPEVFAKARLLDLLPGVELMTVLRAASSLTAAGTIDSAVVATKVEALLSRVRRLLSLSLIKRSVSERFELEGNTVAALLEDAEVLTDLNLGTIHPAIEDFLDMPGSGVDADYFANPTLTGPPTAQRIDATIALSGLTGLPAGIAGPPFSVRWKGFVYASLTEEFTFIVRLRDAVRLWVNGSLVIDEWVAQPPTEFTATVKLRKGTVNAITMEYASLAGAVAVELWWRSPSTDLAELPATAFYTDTALDTYVSPLVRLEKIALVVNGLKLSAADTAAVSRLGFVDWNAVPVAVPAAPGAIVALFGEWRTIHRFAVVRDQVSRLDGAFAGLLASTTLDEALDRFAELTGADRADVQAFADAATRHPFKTTTLTYSDEPPDIIDLEWWSGLRQSVVTLRKTGAPAARMIEWGLVKDVTRVAPAPPVLNWWAMTRNPAARARAEAIGQDLKRMVKAKYNEDTWRSVARPINDATRTADRDALIGYVMAMPAILEQYFDTADELFSFFLVDVKMDPCMETSRIQQGIATIQLALQRWLMGAEEPTVLASSIDRELYKRMQSYAIWHPSREVLIHTEKYIRWDLLDRTSEAYAGYERDLRKQDLTQVQAPERARGRWAETAFMNFLEKVDEVAKLDICGVLHDEEDKVFHVFGRTRTAPYRFYYRRATRFIGIGAHTGQWTAWERLPIDVDAVEDHGTGSAHLFDNDFSGVHLIPVKWNRRLYLMWPQFRLVPDEDYNAKIPAGFDRVSRWDLTLAWSELWNGAWSPKQVSMSTVSSRPQVLQTYAAPKPNTVLTMRIEEKHVHWVPEETGIWPIDLALEFGGVGHYEYYSTYQPGHAANELIEGPGIDISADKDYVAFTTTTTTRAIASYLPGADEHFFTVREIGDRLLITPYVRFFTKHVSGKQVVNTKLSLTVKQGDKITFREKTKDPVETVALFDARVYDELGVFMIGACKVRDIETSSSPSSSNYYVFRPPAYSTNSFQGCRHFNLFSPHFTVGVSGKRILNRTEWLFNVIGKEDISGFQYRRPFFFQDRHRVYLVTPMKGRVKARPPKPEVHTHATATPATKFNSAGILEQATWGKYAVEPEFMFHLHSDPHVCEFIRRLNRDGLFPMLASSTQQLQDTKPQYFEQTYLPTALVAKPYPDEHVAFELSSAYGQYHWELFLYAPMRAWSELLKSFQFDTGDAFLRMVADIMSSNTSKPVPDRVWQFVPFQTADPVRIQESLGLLLYTGTDPTLLQKKAMVQETIQDWLGDPFNPHLIARRRTSAYMQAVILDVCRHYLAAADFEFSRYTMESIPRALQYLLIVLKVLGGMRPSPQRTAGKTVPETYASLKTKGYLSSFSQFSLALADLETELPFTHSVPVAPGTIGTVSSIQTMYFCIPPNDEWARMWDRVADRLYKIRHCMNIEGVVQELPLFPDPPDPMLFVQARAQGIDVSSVFNDMRAPQPHHEFTVIFEKALRMVEDVRAFALRFESLIERGETDELAQMRVEQEAEWLKDYLRRELVQASQQQTAQREAVEQSLAATQARFDHYDTQIKRGLIEEELAQRAALVRAHGMEVMAQGAEVQANLLNMIPEAHAQGVSSGSSFGGMHLGAAARAIGGVFKTISSLDKYTSEISALNAQAERRLHDWTLQRELASIDLKRVDDELAAARLQESVAGLRIENHDKTTANTRAVLDFYRQKFFNADTLATASEDLYPDYFELFQLAYQYARQAEACCRFQFGLRELNIIQFGYWNNARKGLLAGEHLHLALKQLERVYLDNDKREYEIRKDVSLAMLDPVAFLNVKYTGRCEFEIPETTFDADYPGQYMRRLRSASVTVPCVVGRYTAVNCTLTLLKNKSRVSSEVGLTYEEDLTQQDPRFTTTFAAVQSIATSHAQNDSGVFEPEVRDGRYAPFRGAGVVSRWRVDLPLETNSLNRHSMTDVLLHLPYTSREGGELLKSAASKAREKALKDPAGLPQRRLLSAKFESRDEWHRFLHPTNTATAQILAIELTNDSIGPLFKEATMSVSDVDIYVHFKRRGDNAVYQAGPGVLSAQVAHRVAGVTSPLVVRNLDSVNAVLDGAPHGSVPIAFDLKPGVVSTLLVNIPEASVAGIDPALIEKIPGTPKYRLKPDGIEDISLVLRYVLK